MKTYVSLHLCMLCLFFSALSTSAPVPRIGPMHIEGTIESVTWSPASFIRGKGFWREGKWHPMSGSLGRNRTIPARYTVILKESRVETLPSADPGRSFRSGSVITLFINHEANDGYLCRGMRIRVLDYTVGGDEGGDWHSFSGISVR